MQISLYYDILRAYMPSSLKNQKLLIVSPHPDDEAIGCGGTIAKVKQEGGKVYVLFLTVGSTKDFSKIGKSTLFQREREVKHVAAFLQFDDYHIAFPGDKYHLKLDIIGQHRLMDVIERESSVSIENIKPTMVAFPSFASYNQDHRNTYETYQKRQKVKIGTWYFTTGCT